MSTDLCEARDIKGLSLIFHLIFVRLANLFPYLVICSVYSSSKLLMSYNFVLSFSPLLSPLLQPLPFSYPSSFFLTLMKDVFFLLKFFCSFPPSLLLILLLPLLSSHLSSHSPLPFDFYSFLSLKNFLFCHSIFFLFTYLSHIIPLVPS